MDFLGGSEITARADMLSMTNTLQQAQLQAQKAENKKQAGQMQQLAKVSKDFESIFLGYMLKQMRKTVPEESLFGKSNAREIFFDMYDDAVSKELASAGGIGLAVMLYKQLSAAEKSHTPAVKPLPESK
ncbi:MAG TPA: rod-binding protein [Candidatus Goldiibacteriota bacterium]|nr:rod-binding protein [Candidatus Goldiibacteriota bacterium]